MEGNATTSLWTSGNYCVRVNQCTPLRHCEPMKSSASVWINARSCVIVNQWKPLPQCESMQATASLWINARHCIIVNQCKPLRHCGSMHAIASLRTCCAALNIECLADWRWPPSFSRSSNLHQHASIRVSTPFHAARTDCQESSHIVSSCISFYKSCQLPQ